MKPCSSSVKLPPLNGRYRLTRFYRHARRAAPMREALFERGIRTMHPDCSDAAQSV
jgi:hypothetical protein